MKAPTKTIAKAVGGRLGGHRPNRTRASVTAVAAGGAVAATVYRVMRK
jgi:hypothetical protein